MNSIDARLAVLLEQRERERNAIPPVRRIRSSFDKFCSQQASFTRTRSRMAGLPHDLTAATIKKMLVDQQWCCAVSGVPFTEPRRMKEPFAPSLDRITPGLGYVAANVRIVCTIVNFAMNVWGQDALEHLVRFWKRKENIIPITREIDTILPLSDNGRSN